MRTVNFMPCSLSSKPALNGLLTPNALSDLNTKEENKYFTIVTTAILLKHRMKKEKLGKKIRTINTTDSTFK